MPSFSSARGAASPASTRSLSLVMPPAGGSGRASWGAPARGAARLRLEVQAATAPAIALYRKAGYRQFGRHANYYADAGDALRFEKRLAPDLHRLRAAPPYFHQTTEFTCGPACMMMALAWADPACRPDP